MITGRFVLVEDYDIVGGGLISMDGYADQRAGADASGRPTSSASSTGCRRRTAGATTATAAASCG